MGKPGTKRRAPTARGGKDQTQNVVMYGVIGLGVLLSGVVLMRVYDMMFPPYASLSVSQDADLQHAFFSGEPWLIMCESAKTGYATDSFFSAAKAGRSSGEFKAGTLDCEAKMDSGVSTIKRFKLTAGKEARDAPLAFVVANGDKPQRVPSYLLKEASTSAGGGASSAAPLSDQLIKWVRNIVVKDVVAVRNNRILERCVSRRHTILLLSKNGRVSRSEKATASKLMNENKKLRVCVVDKSKYKITAKPPLQANNTKLILLLPRPEAKTGMMALTYVKGLGDENTAAKVGQRITDMDTEKMVQVKLPPTIQGKNAKPKKERKRRPRKEKKPDDDRPMGLGGEITRKRQRKEERDKRAEAVRAARAKKKEEYAKDAPARAERKRRVREKMEQEAADNAFVAQATDENIAAAPEKEENKKEEKGAEGDADEDDDDDEVSLDLGEDDEEDGDVSLDEDGSDGGSVDDGADGAGEEEEEEEVPLGDEEEEEVSLGDDDEDEVPLADE